MSESRIKRITRIARITPHIPTAASSFPSAMSFASAAIDLPSRPPLFASLLVGYACAYKERGSAWLFDGFTSSYFDGFGRMDYAIDLSPRPPFLQGKGERMAF